LDDLQGSQYILKRRKTYPTPQSPPALQAFFCTLPSSETRRRRTKTGLKKATAGLFSGAQKLRSAKRFLDTKSGFSKP
jgi:hypothetical protein